MTVSSTPPEAESSLPALYDHCIKVYEAMMRSSSKQSYIDNGGSKEAIIYEGFLTKLVTDELSLSVPYYTSVLSALKKMGCISQLRRGGSTTPSQWHLHHQPSEELFREAKLNKRKAPSSQYSIRLDAVEEIVAQQNRRILVLEHALENLIKEEEESHDVHP